MGRGSRVREVPTKPMMPTVAPGIVPVVFGTAPVNLTDGVDNINKPIKCESMEDFKKSFGYSDDWKNYTLCEFADSAFIQFGVAPVVFVNVLDPIVHKTSETEQTLTIESNKATVERKGVILSTLKLVANSTTLIANQDYIASFAEDGNVVIAFLTTQTSVIAEYDYIDPTKVTNEDVIGAYDVSTGKVSGMECINKVFPRLRLVPGLIVAPKYSQNPTVAAVMRAKATSVNVHFKSFALTDINTEQAKLYTAATEWKNTNNYTGIYEAVCWPLVALDEKVYHLSTQLACVIMKVCMKNNNFPYESASNKPIPVNKIVVKTATGLEEVELEPNQAEVLNRQGIVTAINFVNGFVPWGNNTAAYPNVTDIKDKFHATRLMHNFIGNTIVLTTWTYIDGPIRRRLIDTVVDTMNMWMNGLQGEEAIIGGRVEARAEDNPTQQLLDGKVVFRYYVAESTPTEEIENILEVDTTYYNSIFG